MNGITLVFQATVLAFLVGGLRRALKEIPKLESEIAAGDTKKNSLLKATTTASVILGILSLIMVGFVVNTITTKADPHAYHSNPNLTTHENFARNLCWRKDGLDEDCYMDHMRQELAILRMGTDNPSSGEKVPCKDGFGHVDYRCLRDNRDIEASLERAKQ